MMFRLQLPLSLFLLVLPSCAEPAPSAPSPTAVRERTAVESHVEIPPEALARGDVRMEPVGSVQRVPRRVTVSGRVQVSPNGVAMLTAPTDARVAAVRVEPGQRVERGQVLAQLHAPAVAVARSALQRSEALRLRAQRLVEQERQLEELQATSIRDSSLARQELAVAEAEFAAAEGNLRAWGASKGNGEKMDVRAPFAGLVSHVAVTAGTSVIAGTQLIRVVKHEALSVLAWVPQGSSHQVDLGQVRISLPEHHTACEGRVLGNLQRVDVVSGTVPFRIAVDGCAAQLLEGAHVELELPLQGREGDAGRLHVPASALTELGGAQVLFVHLGSGVFRAVRVADVEIVSGQVYFRAQGLASAEVATRGVLLLKGELLKGELE